MILNVLLFTDDTSRHMEVAVVGWVELLDVSSAEI